MNSPATPARGDATREALLSAGVKIFARDGYDAATSRALAAAAGVNQALIGYHFGGKEGLYLAVFDYVAQQLRARLAPEVAAIQADLDAIAQAGDDRRARCVRCMMRLITTLGRVFTEPRSADWATLVVREQQYPSPAFDAIYERVFSPMAAVLTRLVGFAMDRDPAEPEVRATAVTIMGQVLVLRVANAAVLRLMDWDHIGETEFACWQAQVRRNLEARFDAGAAS